MLSILSGPLFGRWGGGGGGVVRVEVSLQKATKVVSLAENLPSVSVLIEYKILMHARLILLYSCID